MQQRKKLTCLKVDWDLPLDRDIVEVMVRRSSGKRGLHIFLWVEGDLSDKEKLELQVQLGDDPIRARLNSCRVGNNVKDWNVLFTEKYLK